MPTNIPKSAKQQKLEKGLLIGQPLARGQPKSLELLFMKKKMGKRS